MTASPLDALNRARQAWEATQPQLVLDGWADALDDTDPTRLGPPRVGVVEREASQPPSKATRSTHAAPNHTRSSQPTAFGCRVDPATWAPHPEGSSVPHLEYDGPGRSLGERMRGRGQGG